MGNIRLYLAPGFDRRLAPVPAQKLRDWWEDNDRTSNHAKHCLPLQMANSLGYYILSPGTFLVQWNGDTHASATITHIEKSSHYEVDNHAAFGSFTVQARFIPRTDNPGDFVLIKGVANERGLPYTCLEAVIEAWWNPGNFGLVFLLNQPGEFLIPMGKPIAQMFLLAGGPAATGVELLDGYPAEHVDWDRKRTRPGYRKDLDYFSGLWPDGRKVESHVTSWAQAAEKFNGSDALLFGEENGQKADSHNEGPEGS
jgi:hypothetical protein